MEARYFPGKQGPNGLEKSAPPFFSRRSPQKNLLCESACKLGENLGRKVRRSF
jgi:hypothetical protein